MPGALAVSMLFVVIGVIMIVTAFAKKSYDESSKEKKQMTNKLLIIVAVVVFMIFISMAFTVDCSTGHSEPWRDLGVTKKSTWMCTTIISTAIPNKCQ